jgi:hypothetical protein
MLSFPVDDVAPVLDVLPSRPLGELFPEALTIGGDPARPVLAPDGVHPLLSAVGRAFAEHRPLVLSPDAVWLTIAQGVAQHVRLHAEELRPRLVAHAGRKRLTVSHGGGMPVGAEAWGQVVAQLSGQLEAEISGELFACDFSTSTEVERVAGRIALLDAYSPYFSFWLRCVCGIPSVTLTGTPRDWERIRERVDALAGFGLENWRRSLAPITDQFVRAAAGEADTAFWQRIYNPADAYGGHVITGWAARLYPYLVGLGTAEVPNPLLELPIDEPRDLTIGDRVGYQGPGVRSDAVPATLSRVIVNVNDQINGENRAVALHAGLVGVAQDSDGALRPVAGWHLAPAEPQIDDVLDRIARDHTVTPAAQEVFLLYATAELLALYRRFGSATLFGGAWRILPAAEHRQVWRERGLPVFLAVELADGRSLGAAYDSETETLHWLAGRVTPPEDPDDAGLLDDPADVVVYGTSQTMLLTVALDHDGDIAHLEIGRLSQLDAAK